MQRVIQMLGGLERLTGMAASVFMFACLYIGFTQTAAADPIKRMHDEHRSGEHDMDGYNPQQEGVFETTAAYVVQFYPLWFTYHQAQVAPVNSLVGPDRISPLYQTIVAINDDTLYAGSVLDLTQEPVILTVPETIATYSVLSLDPFGNVFDPGITAGIPETYGLMGPGWTGTLPAGVVPIPMPFDHAVMIFRADKYSQLVDQTSEATRFRESLRLATLSAYLEDPDAGAASILHEIAFAIPFKIIADTLTAKAPIRFLEQLQKAVGSENTPPLSPYEQQLTDEFDSFFGNGEFPFPAERVAFAAGVRTAHALIVNRYLNHTGPTNWIHFSNIGHWGDQVLDRASITEFLQYGNGIQTAAYYHAFKDGRGRALDGGRHRSHGYTLTFPADQLPEAKRFWSVTAYTPESIELVPNDANKYVVASYTPELVFNSDGSLTIHMAQKLPQGVPEANWLPVPDGKFNIMLRIYGVYPDSDVSSGIYAPPAIAPVGSQWRR